MFGNGIGSSATALNSWTCAPATGGGSISLTLMHLINTIFQSAFWVFLLHSIEYLLLWHQFSTCGLWPTLSQGLLPKTIGKHTLWLITIAKLELWSIREIILWPRVSTARGTALKGHSIKKVENHYSRGTLRPTGHSPRWVAQTHSYFVSLSSPHIMSQTDTGHIREAWNMVLSCLTFLSLQPKSLMFSWMPREGVHIRYYLLGASVCVSRRRVLTSPPLSDYRPGLEDPQSSLFPVTQAAPSVSCLSFCRMGWR